MSNQEIANYRADRQAVELLRAVADGHPGAAEKIYTHEAHHGLLRELCSALASAGVSLARTVAKIDERLTADALFQILAERAETGIVASAEIDVMTNDTEGESK